MEKEEMDRIFDRFYKVDTARARNVEGSGLGLSIVQKIVELHNGNVSVYSTKGRDYCSGGASEIEGRGCLETASSFVVLSVNRYNRKIADIIRIAPIYCENRRYNSSCADIFEKSPI